jgi:hypothetical protein
MRRVIANAQGEQGDILKMFCGIDQFTDPVQEYIEKKANYKTGAWLNRFRN